MASKVQKESQADARLNANFNILIENELNAIGKLPPDLADRAMSLLEESMRHKMRCDDEINALEKQNLALKELDIRKYYNWSAFGMVGFFLFATIALIGGIVLAYYDKPTESYIAFGIAGASFMPRFVTEIRKLLGWQ